MIESTHVVIGAAFGDEGKGYVTDKLCDEHTLNVRFNGGAQAGHTVVRPQYGRHIFSHFGAGTFAGATTYLSRDFIVSPIAFTQELRQLESLGWRYRRPNVDEDCRVTTIYDVLYNQFLERQRGDDRHGSCGMGINATVDRDVAVPLRLRIPTAELRDEILPAIGEYYLEKGFDPLSMMSKEDWDRSLDRYVEDHIDMMYLVANLTPVLEKFKRVVMEGAQGLMLDEFNGVFPYVTRSRTGLTNVGADPFLNNIVEQSSYAEVIYTTRPYMTRHGRGPFEDNPAAVRACVDVIDETNVPNPWQESLRLGLYDHDKIEYAIHFDLETYRETNRTSIVPIRAITCMDQVRDGRIDTTTGSLTVHEFEGMIERSYRGAIFGHGVKGMRRVQWVR